MFDANINLHCSTVIIELLDVSDYNTLLIDIEVVVIHIFVCSLCSL